MVRTSDQVEKHDLREIELAVPPEASWHRDYQDTAFIFVGGLPYELSEGDVITIFSQYGEPVFINMPRDKETGKSRGFAYLKYEDQRSCDLAVINLNKAKVLDRQLTVDHHYYKKREGEDMSDNTGAEVLMQDAEDDTESEKEEKRPLLKEEKELAELMRTHDEDDPMKAYLVEQKKEEVQEALKRLTKSKGGKDGKERRHRHRHRSSRHRSHTRSKSPGRRHKEGRHREERHKEDRHKEERHSRHGRSGDHRR